MNLWEKLIVLDDAQPEDVQPMDLDTFLNKRETIDFASLK